MNTSQYMDKQIMDLSGSPPLTNKKDLLDLVNRHSHDDDDDYDRDHHIAGGNGINKEEIMPSYDFQPIRPLDSCSLTSNLDGSSRPLSSADPRTVSSSAPLRMYDSVDTVEPTKVILDKDRKVIDAVVVAEIDRTMKKYTDTLLHVLEGVSARLTQLESRTHHMENSVDDLKVSVGNNQGSTEGKIRHLENILREVQTGVDVLKDKQDIVQAQLQIAKLQMSKVDPQSEHQKSGNIDSVQQTTPHQSHQLPNLSHPPPSLPPPNAPHPPTQQNIAPHPPPQQNIAPPVHFPNQFPQNQFTSVPHSEPYFPPPGRTPEVLDQQYQLPPNQQPHAPPPTSLPHQQYQPPPQQQYSQPPQLPQHHTSLPPVNHHPQLQSSIGHHSEESHYVPSQSYPPSSGPTPSQQFYGPPSHMHEPSPPASRTSSGLSTGYGPPSGCGEQYPYGGTPPTSQYGSASAMKPHQLPSPAVPQGGGSGYPQLPTARALPQALPTASGSAGSGNRVPVDDVIDKVTTMGFPRDHVRATVRKLTENGQAVDLNTVLDKLMNDGEVQPQRGY